MSNSANYGETIRSLHAGKRVAQKRIAELEAELEQERVRLAGSSCASMGYANDVNQGDYGWSAALDDANTMRERAKKAETELARARGLLDVLTSEVYPSDRIKLLGRLGKQTTKLALMQVERDRWKSAQEELLAANAGAANSIVRLVKCAEKAEAERDKLHEACQVFVDAFEKRHSIGGESRLSDAYARNKRTLGHD